MKYATKPIVIGNVKLSIAKLEHGEYKIRWIEDRKLIESKCYYTDDPDDANDTIKAMEDEARKLLK
jgi:hypothetical protein